jgi:K+-transporting ATPase ATPase C chain
MRQLKPAVMLFITFTILTGIIYPAVITGLAQLIFPHQANGSLIIRDGQIIGSELIGQQFNDPKYFWGRPSATIDTPYDASHSGGSNLSAVNPELEKRVQTRIQTLRDADPENIQLIPVDLATSSASGLDPNISVASAEYQAARVARVRDLPIAQMDALIKQYTHNRILGILGERTINVLEINLALDELQ